MQTDRRTYYPPDTIVSEVGRRIEKTRERKDPVDYLTFVPDGEPTLDVKLGETVRLLGAFGIKTAVITNSSLLWREDVREELCRADWVSVKVDAVREETWRNINHPHRSLRLDAILRGILDFSYIYTGKLATETMLVKDRNDSREQLEEIAAYLSLVNPSGAYLSIPTRPPADHRVNSPDEAVINHAYQIFQQKLEHVEYLIGYEGNAFSSTGNFEEDILSITAVHPMQEEAVSELLNRTDSGWDIVHRLIKEGKLAEIEHRGRKFFIRKFTRQK
jgi:wyosine [tRNA(Phe)-imidazoG37] synthetase (radical SAM superfamily)